MTVMSVVTWRVKPGRMDDFLTNASQAQEVILRLATGLNEHRYWRRVVGGPLTGDVLATFTYDSLTDWATTVEREAADPDFNALVAQGSGPDAPAELMARTVWAEIFEASGDRAGSVMQASIGRVKPGRYQDYIGMLGKLNDLAMRHGALRIRHGQAIVGGPATGAVAVTGEFADMADFGQAWQNRNSDPEFSQTVAALTAPDGPVTPDGGISILSEIRLDR